MIILSGTYIFYADVYFIQNFIIKLMVIYLSIYCNKWNHVIFTIKGIGRIALAAFLGTIVEMVGLLAGNSYNVFILLVHVLEIPFMMWIVLGKEKKQMFRVIVTGYFFVMVVNAVLEILWNWFGEQGNYVFYLCVACGAVYAGVRIWRNYTKMQKGIFPIEIKYGGKNISAYGFYDSGNRLADPYTGKGVHIISDELFKQLPIKIQQEVYIPYQSLGNEQGLIKVYYLEYLRIQKEEHLIEEKEVPVGIAEGTLFQNKRYQMILNADVW